MRRLSAISFLYQEFTEYKLDLSECSVHDIFDVSLNEQALIQDFNHVLSEKCVSEVTTQCVCDIGSMRFTHLDLKAGLIVQHSSPAASQHSNDQFLPISAHVSASWRWVVLVPTVFPRHCQGYFRIFDPNDKRMNLKHEEKARHLHHGLCAVDGDVGISLSESCTVLIGEHVYLLKVLTLADDHKYSTFMAIRYPMYVMNLNSVDDVKYSIYDDNTRAFVRVQWTHSPSLN